MRVKLLWKVKRIYFEKQKEKMLWMWWQTDKNSTFIPSTSSIFFFSSISSCREEDKEIKLKTGGKKDYRVKPARAKEFTQSQICTKIFGWTAIFLKFYFRYSYSVNYRIIREILPKKCFYSWGSKWVISSAMTLIKTAKKHLKKEFVVLHIKPYSKNISDHIRYSAALLWWTLQSWELELVADVTSDWKQQRFRGISSASTICQKMVIFKG